MRMNARTHNRNKWRIRAARFVELGLTTRGTVRKYSLHPELHGLGKRRYDRAWKRLNRTAPRPRFGGRLNGIRGAARNTAQWRLHRLANQALGLTARGTWSKRRFYQQQDLMKGVRTA